MSKGKGSTYEVITQRWEFIVLDEQPSKFAGALADAVNAGWEQVGFSTYGATKSMARHVALLRRVRP